MKLQSIAKEAAACREACMEAKVGDPMWLLHHELLLEWLTEPVENRIAYILSEKPKREQARRLRELRPVKGPLPKTVAAAWAEYAAAWAKADAAWAKSDAAQAEYDAAWAEADAAWAEITALHLAECPDTTWNGRSIFP